MKQRVSGALFLVALFALGIAGIGVSVAAPSANRYLLLTALPPRLPTNSTGTSSFPALVVSITDSADNAIVAQNATRVYFSSSVSSVVGVQPSAVIQPGAQYVIAKVSTTETPGSSAITVVSPGYESASITISTYLPRGYPTRLQLFTLPASFSAGTASQATYATVVDDAAGLPARTIQSTPIHVISSNGTIAQVTDSTIQANQTVGYGSLITSGKPGVASLTASASGFVSDTALVSVMGGAAKAVALAISAPTNLPADGKSYTSLSISLLDNRSRPAVASSPVPITLTSSRTDIIMFGASNPVIQPGHSFVTIAISTFPASGSSFVTASSPNFLSATAQVNTVSIPPTLLGMFLADSKALVSAAAGTLNFVVQLEDSAGVPAQARSTSAVIVSFSNTSLRQSPMTLTIAKGTDLVYGSIPLTQGTKGTFTAISNGLQSASVGFSASPLPITHNLGASSTVIHTNQTSTLYFSVQYQGNPLPGAGVTWTSSGGSVAPSSTKTDGSGSTSAVFSPSTPGAFTVTATVNDPVIGTLNSTVSILVIGYPPRAASGGLLSQILSYLYYIIAAAAAAVVVVVFIWRRRRGEVKEEEGEFDIGGPGTSAVGLTPSTYRS